MKAYARLTLLLSGKAHRAKCKELGTWNWAYGSRHTELRAGSDAQINRVRLVSLKPPITFVLGKFVRSETTTYKFDVRGVFSG